MIPRPAWAGAVMAGIQLVDAEFCRRQLGFVTQCLDDVGLPNRYRPLLPPIKAAAAIGLFAGLWVPRLGKTTARCLVVYFSLAVLAHIRATDLGRNAANAAILLVFSAYVAHTYSRHPPELH